MVSYITVSGIDGCGKSTAFKSVSEILSQKKDYKVVQVRRSAWFDKPGADRKFFGGFINDGFDGLHFWADQHEFRTLAGLVNVAYAPVSKIMKAYARSMFKPDIIMSYRDTILDPLAYSSFYFPFTENWSLEAKTHILSCLGSGRKSDLVFYMDLPGETAYTRIQNRIRSETSLDGIERRKFPHMHETPKNLDYLHEQFERVIPYAKGELGLEVVRVDANLNKEIVVEFMLDELAIVLDD